MICLTCVELRTETPDATCPQCGGGLRPVAPDTLNQIVDAKLHQQIAAWLATNRIDAPTASRLYESLAQDFAARVAVLHPPEPPPPLPSPPTLEQRADALSTKLQALEDWRPTWGRSLVQEWEATARAEREAHPQRDARAEHDADDDDGLELASSSGQALFHRGDAGALGGLEALAALDASAPGASDSAPKLYEYVWWFLGALLVLGGSLMGVREAWRALGGVPRQLLVTGALFAYHAGFVGLGVFLARRSAPVGRVLASIGIALLPVVFVALSSLVGLAPLVGGAVAAGLVGLVLLTLRPTGRLLFGVSGTSLGLALLPSLLAGLPLMALGEEPWTRTLCAFAGVGTLATSAWRTRGDGASRATLSVLATSLYGALALALFAVATAPSGFDSFYPGSPLLTGMTLWAMVLATVLAAVAVQPSAREAQPRAAPVVETLSYAVVACGTLAAASAALSLTPGVEPWVDLVSALTPLVAALAFFLLEPRRPALVHPGALGFALAGLLFARLLWPEQPGAWSVGVAAVAAGLVLVARVSEPGSLRMRLLAWGVGLSVLALPVSTLEGVFWNRLTPWPQAYAGALVAVAAHLAGGSRWRGLHYLGGFGLFIGGTGALEALTTDAAPWKTMALLALMAGVYALAALLQEAWLRRKGWLDELLPLDDLSLATAALGVLQAPWVLGTSPHVLPKVLGTGQALVDARWACLPLLVLGVLLLLRTRRDRSRLASALAALGLACLGLLYGDMSGLLRPSPDPSAVLFAAITLGYSVIAMARGPRDAGETHPRGRRILGWPRLPFAEVGRTLYTDGFALVAFLAAALSLFLLVDFLKYPIEAQRPFALLAGSLLAGSMGLAFVSRGFLTWRMRGAVLTLAGVGLLIALTAVINRTGRPLPPDVVALRLPLIGVGLWGLALLTRRLGPWLGRLLDNAHQGPLYHHVLHAGVLALGVLLAVDAWLMRGPDLTRALTVVPPLLLLGSALLWLLLAVSYRNRLFANVGLLLGLPGAALWAVHGTVFGHALVALTPPGDRWARTELWAAVQTRYWLEAQAWLPAGETIPREWYQAVLGVAVAGLVYAVAGALARRSTSVFGGKLGRSLQGWSGVAIGLVFAAAFFQPGLEAAGLTFVTGGVLLAGRAPVQGRLGLGLGLLLLVHALAQRAPFVEAWPGPVLALLGLAVVGFGPYVARWRKAPEERARLRAQQAALFYGLHALLYALACGGGTDSVLAMPKLMWEALWRTLDAKWMGAGALPLTLALLAATLFLGSTQWKGALARWGTGWATVLAGAAALTGLTGWLLEFVERFSTQSGPSYSEFLSLHGSALALGMSGVAALAHVAHRWVHPRREDLSRGLAWGRDFWILSMGGLLTWVVVQGSSAAERTPLLALAALGLAVVVSLHCAWRERTGRHVYFIQVAVLGAYAVVRDVSAQGMSPAEDALFVLVLGFVLVGVTVMARRAGIAPVEQATRRFAALLPLGMALVLPHEATGEAALLAGGSSLLYAALGAVERSRFFGSLAAAACNVALLVGALSLDMRGLEVYLAPLGLLLLMLGQLFTRSLPQAARNAVRTVGGLLLYVPAAVRLSLQIGLTDNGLYSALFGAACLLGVAAGMVLHIRAYLALGTLFLTLDVTTTLVHAGLRDHRVGFLVMTLTGLTIVAGRVLATLRRQELDLLLRRVRVAIRGWD